MYFLIAIFAFNGPTIAIALNSLICATFNFVLIVNNIVQWKPRPRSLFIISQKVRERLSEWFSDQLTSGAVLQRKIHFFLLLKYQRCQTVNNHAWKPLFDATLLNVVEIQNLFSRTFLQKGICSKEYLFKWIFVSKNISSKEYLFKWILVSKDICSKGCKINMWAQ